VIEEDGKELEIPRRMLDASGDGLHDGLMEFTRAVSGATFFAPSLGTLRQLASR